MNKNQSPNPAWGERSKPAPRLFAWLGSVVTLALIVAVQFLPRGGQQMIRISGVLLLLAAAIFIFAPFYLLARYGGPQADENYMQSRRVVDRGLYALTRHPQYLGYMLLATGFALISQHWAALLLAVTAITCFYVQAVLEERYCLAQLGEAYAHYLRRVPRFNLVLGLWRMWRAKARPPGPYPRDSQ
jgi:protein-S-isoprenylcysteine O-methyltransferase Ste14